MTFFSSSNEAIWEYNNVIIMAKLRMAHASTHGARKPPGPIPRILGVTPDVNMFVVSGDIFLGNLGM